MKCLKCNNILPDFYKTSKHCWGCIMEEEVEKVKELIIPESIGEPEPEENEFFKF